MEIGRHYQRMKLVLLVLRSATRPLIDSDSAIVIGLRFEIAIQRLNLVILLMIQMHEYLRERSFIHQEKNLNLMMKQFKRYSNGKRNKTKPK
jgi:hypothetical protein